MKVLLSAYACEPGRGSEPAVGFHWAVETARYHQVWVITRSNNRATIEAYEREHGLPAIHWVYFDLPAALRRWKRGRRGLHAYYYLWQLGAFWKARRLQQRVCFDLVNHVTFVMYWMPSFLSLLPVPFVWGPVGGAESAPRAFYKSFSVRGRVFEHLRDFVRGVAQWDPFVILTARRSRLAIAVTRETAAAVRRLGARRVHTFSQVGLTGEELRQLTALPIRDERPLRFLSIGALLHLKGFHLALDAFARFACDNPGPKYVLVGDGPERQRLERRARALGIHDRVTFTGQLTREHVFRCLEESDVLVHPTLHDSGGFVCLEAMAAGRPVICFDLGGPGSLVPADAGVKIPALAPADAVERLADAMRQLSNETDLRIRLANAARNHARQHFDWNEKGRHIDHLYTSVRADHDIASAPTFR